MKSTQQPRATSRLAPLILACAAASAVIATASIGSCIDHDTMLCSSGLRCPPGSTCTQEGDQCTEDACGNGVTDEGEACDDGNLKFGDDCSGDCLSDQVCGNSYPDIGEECDDGYDRNNALGRCGADCQLNCGNGVLDPMEECDGSFFRVSCLDFDFDRGSLTCSQQCEPQRNDCAYIGWLRQERPADIDNLEAVWGDASGQIYAVGQHGSNDGDNAVLHFDGTSWVNAQPPSGSGRLLGVWGSGIRDVFAVGEVGKVLHYNEKWLPLSSGVTATLRDVWGSGPLGDVIAVGDEKTIVRYTRSTRTWHFEEVPSSVGETTTLEAIWGNGETDVYAVGRGGTILHHTRDGWIHEAVALTDADLFDVWGTSDGEVFAAGAGGIILRRGPDGWSIMETTSETTLFGLWGNSADQVFAVGERGTVLFYDGRTWSPLESGTDVTITAVWGVPGYGIVAVAQTGIVLRYGGWSWAPMPAQPKGGAIRSVWARGLDDVYALTETFTYPQRFDGKTWTPMQEGFARLSCLEEPAAGGTSPLRHLWGNDEGDLYAVGDSGIILRHRPGAGWSCMDIDSPLQIDVHRIWGTDGIELAVGRIVGEAGGIILIHEGLSWQELLRTDVPMHGIWGETPDELFAVGDGGTILHYDSKSDGPTWERVVSRTSERLNAIWGSSRNNIHVVGENGETLQFDGIRWSMPKSIASEHLLDVWGSRSGHMFAVGSNGSAFDRQGREQWGLLRSNTDQHLTTVWGLENPLGNPHAVVFGSDGETFRRFVVNEDVLFGY